MTFRTRTGQTGRDAYLYEAVGILNAKRELDARLEVLLTAMHAEDPELFECKTDFDPWFDGDVKNAAALVDHIRGRA